jgi:hypothetical protein
MKSENNLIKLSIITMIIGLVFLYFFLITYNIKEVSITEIKNNELKGDLKTVKITGKVREFKEEEKILRLKIEQPQIIDVIIFKKQGTNFSIPLDSYVAVEGDIEEFNKNKEIIAYNIKRISE